MANSSFAELAGALSERQSEGDRLAALQEEREDALRQWARGFRASMAVEKKRSAATAATQRFSRAAVRQSADTLRVLARHLLNGEYQEASSLLDSPLIGRLTVSPAALAPGTAVWSILTWLVAEDRVTYSAQGRYFDPALDFMASTLTTLFSAIIQHEEEMPTLNSCLGRVVSELTDVTIKQWLYRFQGSATVSTLRRRSKQLEVWQQKGRLQGVTNLLLSQVRSRLGPGLSDEDLARMMQGNRIVLEVVDPANPHGGNRRLEFNKTTPTEADWLCLETTLSSSKPTLHFTAEDRRSAWATIALLCIAVSQYHTGAFSITQKRARGPGYKRPQRHLQLAPEVIESIDRVVYQWMESATVFDPMWSEPEERHGFGYRTVRLSPVSAKFTMEPKFEDGSYATTDPTGSGQWSAAGHLARTAWQNPYKSGRLAKYREIVNAADPPCWYQPEDVSLHAAMDAATRCGSEHAIHLPIFMDFRGRTYYRPTWLNPQAGDPAKGLLSFEQGSPEGFASAVQNPLVAAMMLSHVRGIVGGPMEKAPISEYGDSRALLSEAGSLLCDTQQAEKPWSALTLRLDDPHQMFQIDGTCNGLQHLSALALDETGGRAVNLTSQDPTTSGPQDIYKEVAEASMSSLRTSSGVTTTPRPRLAAWIGRLLHGGADLSSRKVTKRAVMVIPYGGTKQAIIDYVRKAIIEDQGHLLNERVWKECLEWDAEKGGWKPDCAAIEGGYRAFADRPLSEHPLLRKDCERLGEVVYETVYRDVMPSAGRIMEALRAFAKAAGDRVIQWQTRPDGMWITQARTKMRLQRTRTVGLHLPDMTRTVALHGVRHNGDYDPDQIDKSYPVQAIVPNFIHSHDADHMQRVAARMAQAGHPMGSVHDCFATNAEGLADLYRFTRETFWEKYRQPGINPQHPLMQKVRWRRATNTTAGREDQEWPTWNEALAEVVPEISIPCGGLNIDEVLQSFYFFT